MLGLPGVHAGAQVNPRKILVLGDSLSAEYGLKRGTGWVTLLQAALDQGNLTGATGKPAKYVLQNASISGETTAGGVARLADLLAKEKPNIVIIELGANDALRGLDMGSTEKNLRDMTQMSQQAKAKVLLLGMQIPPNFGKAYSERFSKVFSSVATTEKAQLVPFFLDGIADKLELFQADRIHPTEAAQPRLMLNVAAGLKPLL